MSRIDAHGNLHQSAGRPGGGRFAGRVRSESDTRPLAPELITVRVAVGADVGVEFEVAPDGALRARLPGQVGAVLEASGAHLLHPNTLADVADITAGPDPVRRGSQFTCGTVHAAVVDEHTFTLDLITDDGRTVRLHGHSDDAAAALASTSAGAKAQRDRHAVDPQDIWLTQADPEGGLDWTAYPDGSMTIELPWAKRGDGSSGPGGVDVAGHVAEEFDRIGARLDPSVGVGVPVTEGSSTVTVTSPGEFVLEFQDHRHRPQRVLVVSDDAWAAADQTLLNLAHAVEAHEEATSGRW